jgi:hypothetical protein
MTDRAPLDQLQQRIVASVDRMWRDPALLPAIRKAFGRRGNDPTEGIAM